MKNIKGGISLIVLVITIIIMIILAGVIILSINKSNIIENAKKAKLMSDMNAIQTQLELIIADANIKNIPITQKLINEGLSSVNATLTDNIISYNNNLFVVDNNYSLSSYDYNYTIYWDLDPNDATNIGWFGAEPDDIKVVFIPNTLKGKAIKKIGGYSLFESYKNIKRVIFENGIQIIKDSTFERSSIESIKLPNSLISIGNSSFQESKISDIKLPSGLTNIGSNAFNAAKQLEYIEIPGNISTISEYAFARSGLKTVILAEGIKEIGQGSFQETQLTSIDIPSSVTKIGNWAFGGCENLKNIIIHNTAGSVSLGEYLTPAGCTITYVGK